MAIEPKNIIKHELIGLKVKIANARDLKKKGTTGQIIDETKKMLLIRTKDKVKKVAKGECIFEIKLPSKTIVKINGKLLYGRPEERIKKRLPKKWDVI